jgi:hypothetical protein
VNVKTLGIDLAKNVFRVHGVDSKGRTVVKRQLRRGPSSSTVRSFAYRSRLIRPRSIQGFFF